MEQPEPRQPGAPSHCPHCQQENRAGARFCAGCGQAMLLACAGCGQPAPAGAAFCDHCGQRFVLAAPQAGGAAQPAALAHLPAAAQWAAQAPAQALAQALANAPAPPPASVAERRQLTVMFCDLVDSVTLSARLDPEDFRAVLGAYQRSCGAVIQRFGGHVAQYLGDGILAYFGYPEAHDDDARRAVRAGLDIVAAIAQLDAHLPIEKCVPLAVRMGIHTGLVVVADVGSGARLEQLALGETPNVAARIQGLAQANSVLISEATRRLVHSDVALESVGSHALKGMDKPLPLFRVQGHAQPAAWLAQPLAELIGRQSELLLLQDRWAQTIEGTGQVVCLSGEAGIGKSRLLHALRAHAATVASTCLAACGSAHHQNTAFFPVIELLQGLFRFEPGDSAPERLTKLSCGLAEQGVIEARAPNVFAALLSLPIDGAPVSASAGSQRETLEALLALVLGLAARQPVLLVVEDLHWLDPSTLELLGMLIDQAPTASLFLLTAARPNFEPPWGARPHVNALRLGRLKRAEVERLVLQVTGNKPLPPEVLEQIALKTDGVPLFVEELTKTVLELGLLRDLGSRFELIGPLAPLAIPTTVHDSLMARLDRLSTAKSVAQLAAVLGRSFSHELLQAVAQLESGALQRALQQLVAAEVLQQRGSPPLASYSFKHALVQDAAYESLLRSARQVFHQRIATVMDQQFADLAQAHPELLAHHFTEAGLAAQAIPHWQRAAQLSIERCANREAISQYGSALSLLATLPPSAERAQQELDISLGLGPALMATRGYAAPEVERTYERARELAGGPGQAAQRFAVLTGLWRYYLNRARLQTAREVAEQMVALCGEASDTSLPVMAHYALGTTLYYQGELEAAAAQLDRTVALYDVRRNLSVTATDPRITSLCCGAWVLWLQGHADRALARSQQAIALARELAHLPSLTHALYYTAMLHHYRREPDAAQEHLRSLMACSSERGFAYWEARGTVLQGWIHCQQGEYAKGIAMLLLGIETTQAIGAELAQPNYLAMLAEAYLHGGDVAAGTRLVTQALERVQRTGERRWEAELLRLKGELLIANSATDNAADHATRNAADTTSPAAANVIAAEAAFVQALEVARGQGARALELRAATSLHRLQRRRGHNGHNDSTGANAGAPELEAVCRSFTEGLQTADFLDARALLAKT